MVTFDLASSIALLARTPDTLDAWLRGLPADWTSGHEGGESWSPYDIVGHLIAGEETDWMPRAETILAHGEERAFDPFDRFAMFEKTRGKTLDQRLDEFRRLRRVNLEKLEAMRLEPSDLDRKGRHPALGTVTLGQLIAAWVVHDLGHVRQIARVMAKQYKREIGPWEAYLPVVRDRPGDSG